MRPGPEECRPRVTRIRTTTRLSGSSRRPSPRGAGGRAVRGLRGVGCALRARSRQAQWELIFRVRTGTTTRLSGSSRRPSPRGAGGRAVRGLSQCGRVCIRGVRGPAGRPGRSRLARPGPGPRRKASERAPLGARAESGPYPAGEECSSRDVRVQYGQSESRPGPQGTGRVVSPSRVECSTRRCGLGAVGLWGAARN